MVRLRCDDPLGGDASLINFGYHRVLISEASPPSGSDVVFIFVVV